MIDRVRIATRSSALALWQANFIKGEIERAHPNVRVELVPMTTTGDKWLSSPLSEIGGKGLFVKELEIAMAEDRADIAVHSMKDVPAALPDGFVMPVIAFRADVRDALVTSAAESIESLPRGARIGSSSLRRRSQLLARRPDLSVLPVRGNVNTRLGKLDAGEFDALLLACAGLERLDMHARITMRIDVAVSLPAAGQGALGIECRGDRADLLQLLAPLADPVVAACVTAERAVSGALGADCSLPIAAYARTDGVRLTLDALIADADGTRVLRTRVEGTDSHALGRLAASKLEEQGAEEILEVLRSTRHG